MQQKKLILILISLIGEFFVSQNSLFARTIFIDNTLTSNCLNNYDPITSSCGSGIYLAYNTIQAAANVVTAGDSLMLRAGTYHETVTFITDGQPGSPITFTRYSNEVPILDGQNTMQYGLVTDNASWITIDGLAFKNYTSYGVWFSDQSNNNIVRNFIFSGNTLGIYVSGGDDVLIEYNQVYQNSQGGIFVSWRDTDFNYPLRPRVRYNLSYDNGAGDPESGDGIGSDRSLNGIFENNILWNNRDDGMDISIASVHNIIRNNIAFLNGYPRTLCSDGTACGDGNGIKVSTNGGGGDTLHHNVCFNNFLSGFDQAIQPGVPRNYFYNNVAYGNGECGLGLDVGGRGDTGNSAVVRNNILANNGRVNTGRPDYYACCGNDIQSSDYNFIADNGMPALEGIHSLYGNPLFVNPNATINLIFSQSDSTVQQKINFIHKQVKAMFSLQAGSSAINAGTILNSGCNHCVQSDDINSNQQNCLHWRGTAPDMGAYEFVNCSPYNVNLGNDTAFCFGNNIQLNAGIHKSYVWSTGSSAQTILVNSSSVIWMSVTDTLGCSSTDTINVIVNPLPSVTQSLFSTVCINTPAFVLIGGSPAGGTYSGTGVSGNNFTASIAGIGTHTITYIYTDGNGCSNTMLQNIIVNNCTGINAENHNAVISIYPNPANNLAVIEIEIHKSCIMSIEIYNNVGQKVNVTEAENYLSGKYTVYLNTRTYEAGVYFIMLKVNGDAHNMRKLIVLR